MIIEGMHTALTRVAAVTLFAVLLAAPAPVGAWGFEAHWFIADSAIALLPADAAVLRGQSRAAFVAARRSTRTPGGTPAIRARSRTNHHLDFDCRRLRQGSLSRVAARLQCRGGQVRPARASRPTARCRGGPRRSTATCAGRSTATSAQGPSAGSHIVHNRGVAGALRRRRPSATARGRNYDGQAGGQRGIHTRFEAYLFERYQPAD